MRCQNNITSGILSTGCTKRGRGVRWAEHVAQVEENINQNSSVKTRPVEYVTVYRSKTLRKGSMKGWFTVNWARIRFAGEMLQHWAGEGWLHTSCCNIETIAFSTHCACVWYTILTTIISLRSVHWLVFLMEAHCVLYEVRNESFSMIKRNVSCQIVQRSS